jgi:hypothetical protein
VLRRVRVRDATTSCNQASEQTSRSSRRLAVAPTAGFPATTRHSTAKDDAAAKYTPT